jgi:hypothetical protein
MKAFVLSDSENSWTGFLYDKDCQSEVVRRVLKPGIITQEQLDPDTVAEARDDCRTIVTSNGDHFIRYISDAQKKPNNSRCEDCWGLVILPSADFSREHAFQKANIRNGIQLGGATIPWKAVAYANICVRLHKDGRVQISRFKRCQFCQLDSPLLASWYVDLPIIG